MFEGVLDFVPQGPDLKAKLNATTRAQMLQAMPSLKERAKTLIELIDASYFIFADRPLEIQPKAAALLTPETRELIGKLRQALEAVNPWSLETTEGAMRAFADANNLKLGAVAQPLRVALTGKTTWPGIFEVLSVLGRDECLARLNDQAGDQATAEPHVAPLYLPWAPQRPSCSAHGNTIPICAASFLDNSGLS